MPRNTVAEWDTTAANNTDVGGVNIAEGCAFGNINDAIRTVMAQVRTLNPVATSAIGSTVQAYDADLAAIAALTSAADRLPYYTGAGSAALATFTSYGRQLVEASDAVAARATLGAAPLPVATVGTGQWAGLFAGNNVALVLPAGGTWAYFAIQFDVATTYEITDQAQGIAAGGTTIRAGAPVRSWRGFAWRIA